MKEILVLSGKGGTGKTSFTSSFIYLADQCIACDYDVDASNLPILLKPLESVSHEFSSSKVAIINDELCINCDLCAEQCRFDAISNCTVDSLSCEGCGFCSHICPADAITMQDRTSGRWFKSKSSQNKPFFYAELRPGEENSGKLVARVKDEAHTVAKENEESLIISDGPPGIGCAVISSMVGVNLAVIVSEPSLSGFHDAKRVHTLIKTRGIKSVLIINKYDLNLEVSDEMENWATQEGIYCAGKIPFSMAMADTIACGQVPATHPELRDLLLPIWNNVYKQL